MQGNHEHTDKYVEIVYIPNMYKKKGFFKILVSLSMLFVHIFVHTVGYDCSTKVGVLTTSVMVNDSTHTFIIMFLLW